MTDPSRIGIWLLIGSVVLIVIEAMLAGLWTARLARRGQALTKQLQQRQVELKADIDQLQQSLAETVALWQQYERWLRWLRHPLTVALLQSYARRRAAAQ